MAENEGTVVGDIWNILLSETEQPKSDEEPKPEPTLPELPKTSAAITGKRIYDRRKLGAVCNLSETW